MICFLVHLSFANYGFGTIKSTSKIRLRNVNFRCFWKFVFQHWFYFLIILLLLYTFKDGFCCILLSSLSIIFLFSFLQHAKWRQIQVCSPCLRQRQIPCYCHSRSGWFNQAGPVNNSPSFRYWKFLWSQYKLRRGYGSYFFTVKP